MSTGKPDHSSWLEMGFGYFSNRGVQDQSDERAPSSLWTTRESNAPYPRRATDVNNERRLVFNTVSRLYGLPPRYLPKAEHFTYSQDSPRVSLNHAPSGLIQPRYSGKAEESVDMSDSRSARQDKASRTSKEYTNSHHVVNMDGPMADLRQDSPRVSLKHAPSSFVQPRYSEDVDESVHMSDFDNAISSQDKPCPNSKETKRKESSAGTGDDKCNSRDTSNWDALIGTSRYENISYRLTMRKVLLNRRRVLVDAAGCVAGIGIFFMILEAELFITGHVTKTSWVSLLLKSVVSLSTLMLLFLILAYHVTCLRQTLVDAGLDDLRLLITPYKVFFVCFELLVCAAHPFPGDLSRLIHPSMESVLCISMFMRCYLISRLFLVHSHLVADTATWSLGVLNKVPIDERFVFKALMTEWPGSLLLFMMAMIFALSSWSVRACEAYLLYTNPETAAENKGRFLSEAMWMSAITLLTVGYGDVTPQSDCGRVTSVVVGSLGVLITALLVAVMARKVEQSRQEKYVHTFVSRMRLDKIFKAAAADVVKCLLQMWRCQRVNEKKVNTKVKQKQTRAYGKLLQKVRLMRTTKASKIQVGESTVGVIEVHTAVNEVSRMLVDVSEQQSHLVQRSDEIDRRLANIESRLQESRTTGPAQSIISRVFGNDSLGPVHPTYFDRQELEREAVKAKMHPRVIKAMTKTFDVHTKSRILNETRNNALNKVVLVRKKDRHWVLAETDDFRIKYDRDAMTRAYVWPIFDGRKVSFEEQIDIKDLRAGEPVSDHAGLDLVLAAMIADVFIVKRLIRCYAQDVHEHDSQL